MNKTQRIQTFASGSTHGMTLVGADVDNDGKTTKWLLENSWGMKGYKGYLIMTDQWFDEYMFRLVIDKKYISEKVLKILDSDPVMLPPWDPMFSMEL
jgi:bleomycin hydrolase